MFGCDWQRSEALERLNSTDMVIEVSGTNARALKHGLATYPKTAKFISDILFIETDTEKFDAKYPAEEEVKVE